MSFLQLTCAEFQSNITTGLRAMLENEQFVNVTIAVEGRHLKAHQMVLSLCSPYFHSLLQSAPNKHPIIFMKNVKYNIMKQLLRFMYEGETQIELDDYELFLETANELQIKWLTEYVEADNEATTNIQTNTSACSTSVSSPAKQSKPSASTSAIGDEPQEALELVAQPNKTTIEEKNAEVDNCIDITVTKPSQSVKDRGESANVINKLLETPQEEQTVIVSYCKGVGGSIALSIDNYIYHTRYEGKLWRDWRCRRHARSMRHIACKALVFMTNDNRLVFHGDHNHPPEASQLQTVIRKEILHIANGTNYFEFIETMNRHLASVTPAKRPKFSTVQTHERDAVDIDIDIKEEPDEVAENIEMIESTNASCKLVSVDEGGLGRRSDSEDEDDNEGAKSDNYVDFDLDWDDDLFQNLKAEVKSANAILPSQSPIRKVGDPVNVKFIKGMRRKDVIIAMIDNYTYYKATKTNTWVSFRCTNRTYVNKTKTVCPSTLYITKGDRIVFNHVHDHKSVPNLQSIEIVKEICCITADLSLLQQLKSPFASKRVRRLKAQNQNS